MEANTNSTIPSGHSLAGKKGLIVGIANEHSIAYTPRAER